jgi:hypothetical protein
VSIPANQWQEFAVALRKTNAARGQPPRAASFRGSLVLPSHRQERRDDGTGPTALTLLKSKGVPHLPVLAAAAPFRRISLCNPCSVQRPSPLQRADRRGGRNARATSLRLRASDFPPAIHPRELPVCRWRHRNHPLASLENCHVFAEPTLRQNVSRRNKKTFPPCAETVED